MVCMAAATPTLYTSPNCGASMFGSLRVDSAMIRVSLTTASSTSFIELSRDTISGITTIGNSTVSLIGRTLRVPGTVTLRSPPSSVPPKSSCWMSSILVSITPPRADPTARWDSHPARPPDKQDEQKGSGERSFLDLDLHRHRLLQ